MSKDGCKVNRFIRHIYKNLTLLLFLILPVKVTKVFLELSIALLITELRGEKQIDRCFDMDKFTKLLQTSYNTDILGLPSYTLSWFWTDEALGQKVPIRDGDRSVREILKDDELLRHNLGSVANTVMAGLPYLMKVKLGLNSNRGRLSVRHELMSVLNQGLHPV